MSVITNTQKSTRWERTVPKKPLPASGDEIIDAYLEGKKTVLKDLQKAAYEMLIKNIQISANAIEDVLNSLKKKGFNPKSAFLKINSPFSFEILITVPEKEFLKDDFLSAYTIVSKQENKIEGEAYHVSFSLIDEGKDFDYNSLYYDGFILKHETGKRAG